MVYVLGRGLLVTRSHYSFVRSLLTCKDYYSLAMPSDCTWKPIINLGNSLQVVVFHIDILINIVPKNALWLMERIVKRGDSVIGIHKMSLLV